MRVFILSQKGERERDAIHEKDKFGVTDHRQGKTDKQPYTPILGTKGRSLNRTRTESYVL